MGRYPTGFRMILLCASWILLILFKKLIFKSAEPTEAPKTILIENQTKTNQ